MRNVRTGDLECPHRLEALFLDATRRGLLSRSESDKLAFFGAAERAKRVATRNVPGFFLSIVRQKRYAYLAQSDEDRARLAMGLLHEVEVRHDATPEK